MSLLLLLKTQSGGAPAILVNDPYTRTTSGNWGTEPVSGLSYAHQTSNATFSTTGTKGQLSLAAASSSGGANLAVSVRDVRITATLRSSEIANGKSGAINLGRLSARQNSTTPTDRYMGRVEFRHASNALDLIISRRAGGSESDVAFSFGFALGQSTTNDYFAELTVTGTTSVVVELRVWRDDGSRPSTPSLTYTDNSPNANLQSAGGVGWAGWVNSPHAGPYPILLQVDDFKVENLDATGSTTVEATFTANSILKSTVDASFTADSVTRRTESATFTSNSVLRKLDNLGTFTANGIVRRVEAGTFTANAVIKRTEAGTFTANAILFGTVSSTFNANAVLLLTEAQNFSADAFLLVVGGNSFTADSAIDVIGIPVWTTPGDGITLSDLTPTLEFTMPQTSGDMYFQIELDTVNTFDSGNYRLYDSQQDDTGWEYYDGADWVAFSGAVPVIYAGNDARFTVPTSLTETDWYRRVRGGV